MRSIQTRRRLLVTFSSAAAAGLIGGTKASAQEAPPEITTIRLAKTPGICTAPQFVAETLLGGEGFTNVQYIDTGVNTLKGSQERKTTRPTISSKASGLYNYL